MSSTTVKTNHIYNGLYLVLADHFPAYRTKSNAFDVPGFAKAMGKSHETAYKALRRDSLTLVIAVSIIKFSRSEPEALPLVWSDLLPFVLPQFEAFGVLPGATESPSEVDDILG
jgi:hypothetical protein